MYDEAVQLVCSEAPHLYHRVWKACREERERRGLSAGDAAFHLPCALRVATVATLYGTCEIRRAEVMFLSEPARPNRARDGTASSSSLSEAMRHRLLRLTELCSSLMTGDDSKLFVCWVSLTDAEERCVIGQDVYVIDAARAEGGPLWEGDVHPPNGTHGRRTSAVASIEQPSNNVNNSSSADHQRSPSTPRREEGGESPPASVVGGRWANDGSLVVGRRRSSGRRTPPSHGRLVEPSHHSNRPFQPFSPLGADDQRDSYAHTSANESDRGTSTPTTPKGRIDRSRVVEHYRTNKRRGPALDASALAAVPKTMTTEEWVVSSGQPLDVQALALSTSRTATTASNTLAEAQGQLVQLTRLCSILDVERQESASMEGLLARLASGLKSLEERLSEVETTVIRRKSMQDGSTQHDRARAQTVGCQTDTVVFADEGSQQQHGHPRNGSQHGRPAHDTPRDGRPSSSPVLAGMIGRPSPHLRSVVGGTLEHATNSRSPVGSAINATSLPRVVAVRRASKFNPSAEFSAPRSHGGDKGVVPAPSRRGLVPMDQLIDTLRPETVDDRRQPARHQEFTEYVDIRSAQGNSRDDNVAAWVQDVTGCLGYHTPPEGVSGRGWLTDDAERDPEEEQVAHRLGSTSCFWGGNTSPPPNGSFRDVWESGRPPGQYREYPVAVSLSFEGQRGLRDVPTGSMFRGRQAKKRVP